MRAAFAGLVLFVLLVPAGAGAQPSVRPTADWRTVETEHFRITYHEPLGALMPKLAVICERAHAMLVPLLKHAPRFRTEVLITDDTDFSNGSASVTPFPVVRLYLSSPDNRSELNDYDDWLFALFVHEYTHVLPAGSPRAQKFKFGINGGDNEAPQFQDHVQYVRTSDAAFAMPAAEFGTNYASLRVEPFSRLTIGAPVGGNLPINWQPLPCVTLQNAASATGGSFTDLPATDNTTSTNWPNTGAQQFFRLYKRPLP